MNDFLIKTKHFNLLIKHENYLITNINITNLETLNYTYTDDEIIFINKIQKEFDDYFNNKSESLNFDILLKGTSFQKDVWNYLLNIKYGETKTYEDIAIYLGDKNKVRAVGNAVGKNPILIKVPCHRILRKDKSLGGFSSGIENKKILLNLEKQT